MNQTMKNWIYKVLVVLLGLALGVKSGAFNAPIQKLSAIKSTESPISLTLQSVKAVETLQVNVVDFNVGAYENSTVVNLNPYVSLDYQSTYTFTDTLNLVCRLNSNVNIDGVDITLGFPNCEGFSISSVWSVGTQYDTVFRNNLADKKQLYFSVAEKILENKAVSLTLFRLTVIKTITPDSKNITITISAE